MDEWLDQLTGKPATTLREIHSVPKRAIRQAQARDMALRNVAELVITPKGTDGRPGKALTRQQAEAMLKAAESSELHTYVVISLTTGLRNAHRTFAASSGVSPSSATSRRFESESDGSRSASIDSRT
ncbi:hypothetical protein [Nonomuraea helvata]|uniref:Uncharacterized protein n=1 Tax=Nonomuraea helvata TaxID=37484 RepID=A0ABV5S114_9ACTN